MLFENNPHVDLSDGDACGLQIFELLGRGRLMPATPEEPAFR